MTGSPGGAEVAAEFERLDQQQHALLRHVAPGLHQALAELAKAYEFQQRDDTALSTAEAATLLGVSPDAVRKATKRGKLRSSGTDDSGYLFDRGDVEAYAATRSSRPVAA